MRSYLLTFVLAALFGGLVTPLAMRLAFRIGALDRSNGRAIPRSGGFAIVAGAALALGLLASVFEPTRGLLRLAWLQLGPVVAGAVVILGLGAVDDVRRLHATPKLTVEILLAAGLYVAGVRAQTVWLPFGIVELGYVAGLLFTVLWIVGITNAFNLLDGIDGVAAGSAVFALLAMFVTSLTLDQPMVALLTVALAGATVGFLPFNFAPARVYLGDSGSLFLGFALATLALKGATKGPAIVAISIPIVAFGLPVMDTVFAVVRRATRGAPVFAGDQEHLHHRLLDLGLSPRQTAVALYGVSGAFALASMLFLNPNVRGMAVVLTIVGIGVWLAVRYLRLHEFSELARLARRGLTQTRAISFNVEVRKAAVALEGCQSWGDLVGRLAALFSESEFDRVRLVLHPPAGGPRREYTLDGGKVVEGATRLAPDEWGVHLPFQVGPAGAVNGELAVFRRYGRPSLLTDVNLLVETLRPALVEAAGRVTPPAL
jgi:UDP-GlcNAc:undecaprenyl-phosphate GlcNAc-1-phosphate transferase